jgi:hypothetical protein
MNQSTPNVELIDSIREGKLAIIRAYYDGYKEEFINSLKEIHGLNTFQAEDLYKKTILILVRMGFDKNIEFPQIPPFNLLTRLGEKILAEDFSQDDVIDNKFFLDHAGKELTILESISEELSEVQKKLDDKCKKLLILIYFAKFSLSRTVEILGLKNLEELDEMIADCKSKIREIAKY